MSRTGSTPLVRRAMLAGVGVMLLTSVHHAIGAVVYRTPWRLHVLFAAIPVSVALLAAFAVHRRRPGRLAGRIAAGVVIALVTIFSVALFGLFEGVYNHVLKDALFGLGAPPELMRALFPAPRYVMPDNLLFEVTGVLQAWPAVAAARALLALARLARGPAVGARAAPSSPFHATCGAPPDMPSHRGDQRRSERPAGSRMSS